MSLKVLIIGGVILIGVVVLGLLVWGIKALMDRD